MNRRAMIGGMMAAMATPAMLQGQAQGIGGLAGVVGAIEAIHAADR